MLFSYSFFMHTITQRKVVSKTNENWVHE